MIMIETLLQELEQLERPTKEKYRASLMEKITAYQQSRLDSRYKASQWVGKGGIYFHALQDLRVIKDGLELEELTAEEALGSQACFHQNLQDYLRLLPKSEDPEEVIRDTLGLILKVGMSAEWIFDRDLVINLERIYGEIDEALIQPWSSDAEAVVNCPKN